MHRFILFFTALLMSGFSSFAQKMDLFDNLIYTSSGDSLPYRLLKPVNPQSFDKFPLVIFLHGAGERGNDNEAQIKHIRELFLDEKYRGKYPCYLVAPQCPKGKWWADFTGNSENATLSKNPSDPMKMVITLIEKIIVEYPIDESRIYITGLSMGGYGTWDLIARYPQKFAAAVPICGGGDVKTASQIQHIPLWAFHGAKDKIVIPSQSRRMIKALQDAGGLPGYSEYPDVEHNSWVYAYREPHLMHWLFKQKKGDETASK
ncbi:MAG TPA: prolyl oligopeptidase family serine peptidase [Chryseosolibacter sp.]|nr:prolyl oligopeptidase family serine peptidase [Chryseosolibacter sp.]